VRRPTVLSHGRFFVFYAHPANAFLLFYQMKAAHATKKAKIFYKSGADGAAL